MNNETTAIRTPTALHFDRVALANEIQGIQKKAELLEAELAVVRKKLAEKQNKMNQLALIAVGRLRKHGRT